MLSYRFFYGFFFFLAPPLLRTAPFVLPRAALRVFIYHFFALLAQPNLISRKIVRITVRLNVINHRKLEFNILTEQSPPPPFYSAIFCVTFLFIGFSALLIFYIPAPPLYTISIAGLKKRLISSFPSCTLMYAWTRKTVEMWILHDDRFWCYRARLTQPQYIFARTDGSMVSRLHLKVNVRVWMCEYVYSQPLNWKGKELGCHVEKGREE